MDSYVTNVAAVRWKLIIMLLDFMWGPQGTTMGGWGQRPLLRRWTSLQCGSFSLRASADKFPGKFLRVNPNFSVSVYSYRLQQVAICGFSNKNQNKTKMHREVSKYRHVKIVTSTTDINYFYNHFFFTFVICLILKQILKHFNINVGLSYWNVSKEHLLVTSSESVPLTTVSGQKNDCSSGFKCAK